METVVRQLGSEGEVLVHELTALALDGGGWSESSYVPLAVVQAAARYAQEEIPAEGPAAWTIRSDDGAPAMEVFVGHETRPVPLPH